MFEARHHLDETRFTGYRTLGTLSAEIVRLARSGEPFVVVVVVMAG